MSLSRCSGGWEKGRAGFRLAVVSIPDASAREQHCKVFSESTNQCCTQSMYKYEQISYKGQRWLGSKLPSRRPAPPPCVPVAAAVGLGVELRLHGPNVTVLLLLSFEGRCITCMCLCHATQAVEKY
jgi:hypothetical protein